ncbi:core-2/I-Branching enzyme [Nitrospirillum amazonense]|uniref:Peptide O-xylosyltransferase n=1 Tax=Nitrospirillum amazonense TaxID=28077 RepID=A0A560EXS7_9PROT|nr:beta-1,6-N-acetylglucosaminyltransferase [Nitrospirillum amazonense]TWB14146.1 core-2/I-Branching enzyme [Nitrospirillum amazonense]
MANCYFISCHRAQDHVADLFRFLYRPDHLYVIHCDPKAPAPLRDLVARLAACFPNVVSLPAQPYSWGGYSMVTTLWRALEAALAHAPDWSHFFWLSEQHLPLFAQEDTRWTLEAGCSYSDAAPVAGMWSGGQADVLHRFSLNFRELPGVGAFPTGPQAVDWTMPPYHGSNWMALDRGVCALMLERAGPAADLFAHSVQPDETMPQTLLMAAAAEGRARVRGWNPTYVAWPNLCGNPDMLCTMDNVAAARAEGRLFIRKRPPVMPEAMRAEVEAMAAFSDAALMERLGMAPPMPETRAALAGPLMARVAALAAGRQGYVVERFDCAELNNVPAFYVTMRPPAGPATPPGLRLCVLSEDMRTFKVLIVVRPPPDGDWAPVAVGPHQAYPLRLRVYGLFLEREVAVAEEADAGFVMLGDDGDLVPLDDTIRRYLLHMDALAGPPDA